MDRKDPLTDYLMGLAAWPMDYETPDDFERGANGKYRMSTISSLLFIHGSARARRSLG